MKLKKFLYEILRGILKKLGLLEFIKKQYKTYKQNKKLSKKYIFEDRKKDHKKVCFVLSGYKMFLNDIIFLRLKEFVPEDVEVCILSSGVYRKELSDIAKQNDWSYLSTSKNNVCLVQNVAITMFDKAKYIYKLDEDIFITEGFFDTLFKTYKECEKNGDYDVGFVAPTIPINGFGNMLVLEKFNKLEYYTKVFEKPLYASRKDRMIESNPEVAKFFWGENNVLPNIDEMNRIVSKEKFEFVACPVRFSIGAILFSRDLFYQMEMFDFGKNSGLGFDEEKLCKYCVLNSRAMIVSKNNIVGHLSFTNQNSVMKKYFEDNKSIFNINKVDIK